MQKPFVLPHIRASRVPWNPQEVIARRAAHKAIAKARRQSRALCVRARRLLRLEVS